ncbi:hypothetical protein FRB99_008635 [Tulasnella sp. 403]|nr:hypothetical protein FRB99_008635 [Tulasnella sp. 403]
MSLSAAVTRILTLSGFPSELKTRDIQAAFSEWENERGGFKIKWVDDTTLMLVFTDAGTAKRAYLSTLLEPPTALLAGIPGRKIVIKPYDGPDAQAIIQNVNNRTSNPRGHNMRQSVSAPNGINLNGMHKRGTSYAGTTGSLGRAGGIDVTTNGLGNGNGVREPSPTLPSLPSHPTLNSLISSSLPTLNNGEGPELGPLTETGSGMPPKVGDPARRMVGHALGIRHPGIGRGDLKQVEKSMGGLAIMAE